MTVVTFDAWDPALEGFYVVRDSGFDDGVEETKPTVNPGGLAGQVVAASRGLVQPRKCSLTLGVRQTTPAALRAAFDALRGRLSGQGLTLTHLLYPSREITVRADGAMRNAPVSDPRYVGPFDWEATIPVIADNPWWRSTSATVTGSIQTTPVDIPTGTGPALLDVTIDGPATAPVLTLADADGTDQLQCTFTEDLLSGEKYRLNRLTQRVEFYNGSVWADAWDKVAVAFDFMEVWREWCRPATAEYATLRVSSGTATCTHTDWWE